MDPSQQISVLLAEYNTLRAEVFAARNNFIQATALMVPVATGLVGLSVSTAFGIRPDLVWLIVSFAVIYLAVAFFYNDHNLKAFTEHLRSLEGKINALAGEQLLTWEGTRSSGSLLFPLRSPPTG